MSLGLIRLYSSPALILLLCMENPCSKPQRSSLRVENVSEIQSNIPEACQSLCICEHMSQCGHLPFVISMKCSNYYYVLYHQPLVSQSFPPRCPFYLTFAYLWIIFPILPYKVSHTFLMQKIEKQSEMQLA